MALAILILTAVASLVSYYHCPNNNSNNTGPANGVVTCAAPAAVHGCCAQAFCSDRLSLLQGLREGSFVPVRTSDNNFRAVQSQNAKSIFYKICN